MQDNFRIAPYGSGHRQNRSKGWQLAAILLIVILVIVGIIFLTSDEREPNTPQTAENKSAVNNNSITNQEDSTNQNGLDFSPDPGIAIENASNPGIIANKDGTWSLLYEDRSTIPRTYKIANSADGRVFGVGVPTDSPEIYRAHKLPDGTYRTYIWDEQSKQITSMSSRDGLNFSRDQGVRYKPAKEDNGSIGAYDFFNDEKGDVIMLYVGDIDSQNNVRRAYSSDNGLNFRFEKGNVFGDDRTGGGSRTYVDPNVIALPNGRYRAFTMRQGTIYSSDSSDGAIFRPETGARLQPSDFKEIDVVSLHDPQVILLPDGRYRMYLTAIIGDGPAQAENSNARQVIVSATTKLKK